MEEIMDIIIRIVAMLLALGAGVLGKYLVNWIKSNTDEKTAAQLDLFIAEMVAAAEQLYKQEDPDGSVRLAYVQKMLIEAGYEITDAVMGMIESKVYSINLANGLVGDPEE